MSPTSIEAPQALSERIATAEHPTVSSTGPAPSRSFAVLLTTKRQDAETSSTQAEAKATPPRASLWEQLKFLVTASVDKVRWEPGQLIALRHVPKTRDDSDERRSRGASGSGGVSYAVPLSLARTGEEADPSSAGRPLSLASYPRPPRDNGWGMHWIPTLYSPPEVVDRFVSELKEMGIKWAVCLNDGTDVGGNDYLVKRLVEDGIMPVMRIYTPGLVPIAGDLEALVRHYKRLGVSYFQIYNEPNLGLENNGDSPEVKRYLDLWVPAAKRILAAGGLPGFGGLSPNGEVDDRDFLRSAVDELKRRGEEWVLNRGWLSMHNYAGALPLDNPDGFLRFRQYADILRQHLGRVLPIIGTEAGTYVTQGVDESRQVDLVSGAYRHMAQKREPYNFAYTYWILANQAGGGQDESFEWQALFRPGGWVSPLVKALKRLAGGA